MKDRDFKAHRRLMNWAVSLTNRQYLGQVPTRDYWWAGVISIERKILTFGLDINSFLQRDNWENRLLLEVCRYETLCHPWGKYLFHEADAYSELPAAIMEGTDADITVRFKDGGLFAFTPQECLLCHNRIPPQQLLTKGDIKLKIKVCEDCSLDAGWKKGLAKKIKAIAPIFIDSNKFNQEAIWSFYADYVDKYLDPAKPYTPRGALVEGEEAEWQTLAHQGMLPSYLQLMGECNFQNSIHI